MKPKLWMVATWAIILAVLVGVVALAGGQNCEVPKTGALHWLLKDRKYVPTHSRYFACRQVK